MSYAFHRRGLALASIAVGAIGVQGAIDQIQAAPIADSLRVAQADPSGNEKQAFESAKDLGTVEAWDAFLSAYSTGFYADLARAYVKKLADPGRAPVVTMPPNAPAAVAPMMRPSIGMLEMAPSFSSVSSTTRAARRPCSEGAGLASQASSSAARISFINYSADPIEVFWIDETGAQQLFGQINKDRQATVETFVTQPWVVKYLDGTCLAVAMPNPGPQIFPIGQPSSGSSTGVSKPPASSKSPASTKSGSSKSGSCKSGQIRVEGKCMSKSAAVGYCGPGYRVRGGKCVHQNEIGKKKSNMLKRNEGGLISEADCKRKGMIPEMGYCVEND